MRGRWTLLIALACAGLWGAAADADFYLHNTLDLSDSNYFDNPLFDNESPYGTNPSAVTTDGMNLWLAGFNGGTSTNSVAGIVKISDPWGTPIGAPVASFASTPGSRGFSGLAYDYNANVVLSAYDNGGAHPDGIAGWDPTANTQMWGKNARGGSGVGDDPGFGGVDMGAAWTTFGSGRRALQNSATGADIYTTADGMIIATSEGTFWRDMDFAPDGDIWLREGNNVIMANRTGGNSVDAGVIIFDQDPDADYVNGQNIAYLDQPGRGDLVIYNDRSSTAVGQPWSWVVQLIKPDGTPATEEFLDGLGAALPFEFAIGSGYYDFEWYAPDEILIVSDFSNRLVYQFRTFPIPEPASLLLLLAGVGLIRRR